MRNAPRKSLLNSRWVAVKEPLPLDEVQPSPPSMSSLTQAKVAGSLRVSMRTWLASGIPATHVALALCVRSRDIGKIAYFVYLKIIMVWSFLLLNRYRRSVEA